jgi:hypothetical protein
MAEQDNISELQSIGSLGPSMPEDSVEDRTPLSIDMV